jgi:hypothetical protein
MPDWGKIVDLFQLAFGTDLFNLIIRCLAYLVALWLFLWLIHQIGDLFKNKLIPLFYNPDEKRRNRRRKRFADHINREIRKINSLEEWSDYRFAELEAEVEAKGIRKQKGIIPFIPKIISGLRREKSLSKAFQVSEEYFILLEGDPGSGKSIALRHMTLKLSEKASKSNSNQTVIPIYINLKELERDQDEAIDRNLIHKFIIHSINRINDRDIDHFIYDEFQQGIENGSWLFLFDSFDEIPEILGAFNIEKTILLYSKAISDFLSGMNKCRGVVASRYFRGPGYINWPRFRISPLTRQQRIDLIKKADIGTPYESILIGCLDQATQEIKVMTGNPLFLSLAVEYVREGNPFPDNTYAVFESYIESRLIRDKERIQRRFNLLPYQVRLTAEQIAFCMTADNDLGLSPTRKQIFESLVRFGFPANEETSRCLDALEFIKLGRSEIDNLSRDNKLFTFSHRRFQEYFATRIVIRDKDRVSFSDLLMNSKWRETAVVICQISSPSSISSLIDQIRLLICAYSINIRTLMQNNDDVQKNSANDLQKIFPWPEGLKHLLSLLQIGFNTRSSILPIDIRREIGFIVKTIYYHGFLPDKLWALDSAGCATDKDIMSMINDAFAGSSNLLHEIAFWQISRLSSIPEYLSIWIQRSLYLKIILYRIYKERYPVNAYLARLTDNINYFSYLKYLYIFPIIELLLLALLIFPLILFIIQYDYIVTLPNDIEIVVDSFIVSSGGIFLFGIFISHVANVSYLKKGINDVKYIFYDSTAAKFLYLIMMNFMVTVLSINYIQITYIASYFILSNACFLYFYTEKISESFVMWFFSPFILVWRSLTHYKSFLKNFISFIKSSRKELSFLVILFALYIIKNNVEVVWLKFIVSLLVGACAFLILAVLVLMSAYHLLNDIHETYVINKIFRSINNPMSPRKFIALLYKLNTIHYQCKYIDYVISNSFLSLRGTTKNEIANLIIHLDEQDETQLKENIWKSYLKKVGNFYLEILGRDNSQALLTDKLSLLYSDLDKQNSMGVSTKVLPTPQF